MRSFLHLLLLLVFVLLVVSAGTAFQMTQPQTEPKIAIRCGPVGGVILKEVTPMYPAEALAKGVQGTVRISVLVDKDGVPDKLRVLSGPPELVNASLDAVKQWRYKPYRLNGKAVPVETSIDIDFVIPPKKSVTTAAKH